MPCTLLLVVVVVVAVLIVDVVVAEVMEPFTPFEIQTLKQHVVREDGRYQWADPRYGADGWDYRLQ